MAILLMYIRFYKHPAIFIMVLLCLCVVMQMLGVSATILNPSATPDTLGAAVLEGLAIPPAVPPVMRTPSAVLLEPRQESLHALLLTHSQFHPPVSR
jgi:hypothetical protein